MNALDGLSIAMLLALVGGLLVVAEVFFPSGGVLGFLAVASFIGAIYSAYSTGGWLYGLGFATAEVFLAPVLVYLALTYLPYTPMGKVLVGSAPTEEEVAPDDSRRDLTGSVGVARSKMLPAGSIEIEGRMIDAVSQSQAIDPGEYVKVIEVRGNRVVVRRAGPDERPTTVAGGERGVDPLSRPADELGLESFDFDAPDQQQG